MRWDGLAAAVFTAGLLALSCTEATAASAFPRASGMVLIDQLPGLSRFLIVQDLKGYEDGDRLGLYSIDTLDAVQHSPGIADGGDSYVGIPVDWDAAGVERASDLE